MDPQTEERKIEELRLYRRARDSRHARQGLDELVEVVRNPDANVMPATIEAVRARATGGEIVEALRAELGTYVETAVF